MIEHLGDTLRDSKFGFRMTRAMYGYPSRAPHNKIRRDQVSEAFWADVAWAYRDDEHTRLSDAYLLVQRDEALRNYDLSMAYFASLDATEFEGALQHVLTKARTLKQVEHLPDWNDAEGVYIMVFDDYKQFYVGRSDNIRERIKQHWAGRKSFDRLVFGGLYSSILPVDELRALDNTRIFAARSRNQWALEERTEAAADPRFCLNRMAGGDANPLKLVIGAASPRGRSHGTVGQPCTASYRAETWDQVERIVQAPRGDGSVGLIDALSSLDMTIYTHTRDDGSTSIWSRRDFITSAVIRGDLAVSEYSTFLEHMGEQVIWPDEPVTRKSPPRAR